MYSPIVVVGMLGLVAMCAASDPIPKKAVLKNNIYPEYGFGDPKDLAALDEVANLLRTLEAIEEVQDNKIERLEDSANANLNFQNDATQFLGPRILDEQKQQNERIRRLRGQIKEIKNLQENVHRLYKESKGIKRIVDEIYTERKQVMYAINDLNNAALESQNRIDAEQSRADNTNDNRIDPLILKSRNSSLWIFSFATTVTVTIDVGNRVAALSEQQRVSPDGSDGSQTTKVDFRPEFLGVPQFIQAGFNAICIKRKHDYYPDGYPSIYFSLRTNLMNNEVKFEAVDASSGDFSVTEYIAQTTFGYFSTEKVPKPH